MLSAAAHLHTIYSLNLDFDILAGTSGITDTVNVSITRSPHGLGIKGRGFRSYLLCVLPNNEQWEDLPLLCEICGGLTPCPPPILLLKLGPRFWTPNMSAFPEAWLTLPLSTLISNFHWPPSCCNFLNFFGPNLLVDVYRLYCLEQFVCVCVLVTQLCLILCGPWTVAH